MPKADLPAFGAAQLKRQQKLNLTAQCTADVIRKHHVSFTDPFSVKRKKNCYQTFLENQMISLYSLFVHSVCVWAYSTRIVNSILKDTL